MTRAPEGDRNAGPVFQSEHSKIVFEDRRVPRVAANRCSRAYPGELQARLRDAPEIVDPVSVNSLSSDNSLHVYPNPASDRINIVYNSSSYQINLINSLGVNVYSSLSNSESVEMDISKFAHGIYILKITDSNNAVSLKKIVVK
jgi:hypothetical protein